MTFQEFIFTAAAVFLGNAMTFVVAYGLWRASWAEKHLGIKNGGDLLPLPLLIAMLVPFAITGWAALSLQ